MVAEPELLTRTLPARAERTPDVVAYEYAGAAGVETLTYAQLAGRAAALARRLAAAPDGPVLLALPAGLDYVVAVFGGFLAGRPVIPAFPPGPTSRADRDRLGGIVADARPPVVVADGDYAEIAVPRRETVPGPEADGTPVGPVAAGDDVAVVQYTSGSTGRPRGVLVRHDSLAANTAAIAECFGLDPDSRGLTWLPPFHDMGLVGGLLTPMTAGICVRILAPGDFLKAPLGWLRQIGESGATHSGGPDFGYDLCVRRARDEAALAGIDLSRWRVAFSGGETVKRDTLAAFARRFAPAGFRAEAFLPCYGLAEATLIVTAGHWDGGAATPVSCGTPVRDQRVAVVDQHRLRPVDDGTEGEIWVAGPHVTPGYLGGGTGELFSELDGVRFLRTGDLGSWRDGELVVRGRSKDVLVVRGVNHHAADVEAAARQAAGPAARTGAAFAADGPAGAVPVLLQEMAGARTPELAAKLRAAVLDRTGLLLGLVALVPPRSLPRTSSGKIRRSAAREALLRGEYAGAVGHDSAGLLAPAGDGATDDDGAAAGASADLAVLICGILAEVCEAGSCRPTDDLTSLGVDSVRGAEAAAVLEHALGLTVPVESMLTVATPQAAADALLRRWRAGGHDPAGVRERMALAVGGAGVR
ncbi:non-ribosomal peptide synthetase [Actinoplanes sp. NPDC049316]|uniref:non-ribosomal peptide synthetase n=1 Tax=Actinoplanes sp. NPDC049316 TaxID=3154727 RepID=UPI00341B2F2C